MRQILLLIISTLTFTNISAQLNNFNANGKIKIVGENTSLTITTQNVEIKTEKQAATAVIGTILAPLVDVFIKGASEMAKHNSAKFQNSIVVSASGEKFWADETHANLPVLTIIRKIIKKGQNTEADAFKITLTPELSVDRTAFRLVATTPFNFTYSSAKTKGEYDYIDISLDIKFKAFLVSKSQYEVKDLRITNITIPMVKPGSSSLPSGSYKSGWLPFPAVPTLEVETDVTEKTTVSATSKGKKDSKDVDDDVTTVTTTLKEKVKDVERLTNSSGIYEFEVTINQTNPYKIKAENKQKIIEASGDASSTLLKAIIDAVFKKDEKKDKEEESN